MSGSVIPSVARPAPARQGGIALLELLVALLIFSIGLLGLLSGQLIGKRAAHDALHRTIATGLARDLLERIQANPANASAYRLGAVGAPDHTLPEPTVDCNATECSAGELATFDLWQWESLLRGGAGARASAGGLPAARACITGDGSVVAVDISWLGLTLAGPRQPLPCTAEGDVDDEQPRHWISVTANVAGP